MEKASDKDGGTVTESDDGESPGIQLTPSMKILEERAANGHDRREERRYRTRRISNRRCIRKVSEMDRNGADAEKTDSSSWNPAREVELHPEVGMEMDSRWKCERYSGA